MTRASMEKNKASSKDKPIHLHEGLIDEHLLDQRGRSLAWVIRDISRLYTAVGQKALAPWGITMAHWYYLRVLEAGPLTQLELSKRVGMASATAVPAVDFLEKNKLVLRTRDPNDRRKYSVSLTDNGQHLINEVMQVFAHVLGDAQKGATKEEIATMWKTLLLLESNLIDACKTSEDESFAEVSGKRAA